MLSTTKGEIGAQSGTSLDAHARPGYSTFLRRVGCPVSRRVTGLACRH